MKPTIYLIKNRRLLLHISFLFAYLLVFLLQNWDVGKMSAVRLGTLVLLAGAGMGVAYQARYAAVLAVRLHRVRNALLLFFCGMVGIGVLGYIVFHGVSNPMAAEVVHTPEAHPWKDYARFYLHWYFMYAKYGIIFFFMEKWLFQRWDKLLAHGGASWKPEKTVARVSVDGGAMSAFDDRTVAVPAQAIPLVHQINALLGFKQGELAEEALFPEATTSAESPWPGSAPPEPEHVTIAWILDFLNVGRSTFYRRIRNEILFEVCRIGNRPYYLKSEVKALMVRHEKGSWTFSK